ncbi:hypothetical protein FRC03_010652 [Tulasnella sp. 419]|nr:hypothetical protein FRC03_010652 [Tulasnella sp. 419]
MASSCLTDIEITWSKRSGFLETQGYRLRPRYQPDWRPSWITASGEDTILGFVAEDAITLLWDKVLDAIRINDDVPVMLKHVKKDSSEPQINQLFSSPQLRIHKRNHCVPLLDVLEDPSDPDHVILVFPMLQRLDRPSPATIGECVDFVEQTLEGLAFMHEHQVAHRDCSVRNIMMDARRMFDYNWHPVLPSRKRDGSGMLEIKTTRTESGGVRYYFIDFGISSMGQDFVLGIDGQEEAPELKLGDDIPYDPFKLDVYILGMAYRRLFMTDHRGAEAILPLVRAMTVIDPGQRPSAADCIRIFSQMKKKWSSHYLKGFLRPYKPGTENFFTTFLLDWVNAMANFWTEGLEEPEVAPPLSPFLS